MKKLSTNFYKILFACFVAVSLSNSVNAQCSANFTWVVAGMNVTFTNTSTGFGNNTMWSWSFGDSQTATTMNATHTYSAPGTYIVCLGGLDLITSCYDSTCHTIVISSSSVPEIQGNIGSIRNYPNPFGHNTTIGYSLRQQGEVVIAVYDLLGTKVADVENAKSKSPGDYQTTFDASALPEGIYFLRMTLNGNSITSKITITR